VASEDALIMLEEKAQNFPIPQIKHNTSWRTLYYEDVTIGRGKFIPVLN
jgi:hypothetical protein